MLTCCKNDRYLSMLCFPSFHISIYRCDKGYEGEFCVPNTPLPMMLRDDFNRETPKNDNWLEIHGGETTQICGSLVSGNALTFSHVGGIFELMYYTI